MRLTCRLLWLYSNKTLCNSDVDLGKEKIRISSIFLYVQKLTWFFIISEMPFRKSPKKKLRVKWLIHQLFIIHMSYCAIIWDQVIPFFLSFRGSRGVWENNGNIVARSTMTHKWIVLLRNVLTSFQLSCVSFYLPQMNLG